MKKAASDRETLLLDVNALLALGWANHQFHAAVLERLDRKPPPLWATCALTQLGFVRLSSNPAAVGTHKSPAEALDLLTALVADPLHVFVGALPPAGDVAGGFSRILGHRQVTDAYLGGLARSCGARLLTFDRRLAAVGDIGAVETLPA